MQSNESGKSQEYSSHPHLTLLDILEGHNGIVWSVAWSPDGRVLASGSQDRTIRLWDGKTRQHISTLEGHIGLVNGVSFSNDGRLLASNSDDETVRIWNIDIATLLNTAPITTTVHYTTAKIALVGDSAVGKSGLGYRIAEDRFQITESTHGQQFWVVEKLGKMRHDGTECEAVLWDFAGQPNFRPIHALLLE